MMPLRRPRILGIVVAKDEWPVVGLSVVHALQHVDQVVAVDHGSTDASLPGLEALAARHPGRLVVVPGGGLPWWQAAITRAAMSQATRRHDWVYVFDADEFLLTAGTPLARVLAAVPRRTGVVRYQVHNWVAPFDADDRDPAALTRIRHRSRPGNVLPPVPQMAARHIATGGMNWFDIPFDSKVVVRSRQLAGITKGAHHLEGEHSTMSTTAITAAHLPFLSRARLDTRIEQGRTLEGVYGDDIAIGWQSRMIARLHEGGALDLFWARHSVGGPEVDGARPLVAVDDTLAADTAHAVRVVSSLPPLTPTGAPRPVDPAFEAAVHAAQARHTAG